MVFMVIFSHLEGISNVALLLSLKVHYGQYMTIPITDAFYLRIYLLSERRPIYIVNTGAVNRKLLHLENKFKILMQISRICVRFY